MCHIVCKNGVFVGVCVGCVCVCVCVWFSKNIVSLWQIWHYQCVPCEIPFLKMYTFIYFYEFVQNLCYKIKMSNNEL